MSSPRWREWFNRLDREVNLAEVLLNGDPIYFDSAQTTFLQINAGALRLTIGGTGEYEWDGTAFYPVTNGGADVGTTALRFANLFVQNLNVSGTAQDSTGRDFVVSDEWLNNTRDAIGTVDVVINGTTYSLLYVGTTARAVSPTAASATASATDPTFVAGSLTVTPATASTPSATNPDPTVVIA